MSFTPSYNPSSIVLDHLVPFNACYQATAFQSVYFLPAPLATAAPTIQPWPQGIGHQPTGLLPSGILTSTPAGSGGLLQQTWPHPTKSHLQSYPQFTMASSGIPVIPPIGPVNSLHKPQVCNISIGHFSLHEPQSLHASHTVTNMYTLPGTEKPVGILRSDNPKGKTGQGITHTKFAKQHAKTLGKSSKISSSQSDKSSKTSSSKSGKSSKTSSSQSSKSSKISSSQMGKSSKTSSKSSKSPKTSSSQSGKSSKILSSQSGMSSKTSSSQSSKSSTTTSHSGKSSTTPSHSGKSSHTTSHSGKSSHTTSHSGKSSHTTSHSGKSLMISTHQPDKSSLTLSRSSKSSTTSSHTCNSLMTSAYHSDKSSMTSLTHSGKTWTISSSHSMAPPDTVVPASSSQRFTTLQYSTPTTKAHNVLAANEVPGPGFHGRKTFVQSMCALPTATEGHGRDTRITTAPQSYPTHISTQGRRHQNNNKSAGHKQGMSVRPADHPSGISARPTQHPSGISVRPTNHPSGISVKPTYHPSGISARPVNHPSGISARPVNDPSEISARPVNHPSGISARPVNDPSGISARPVNDPSEISVRPVNNQATARPPTDQVTQVKFSGTNGSIGFYSESHPWSHDHTYSTEKSATPVAPDHSYSADSSLLGYHPASPSSCCGVVTRQISRVNGDLKQKQQASLVPSSMPSHCALQHLESDTSGTKTADELGHLSGAVANVQEVNTGCSLTTVNSVHTQKLEQHKNQCILKHKLKTLLQGSLNLKKNCQSQKSSSSVGAFFCDKPSKTSESRVQMMPSSSYFIAKKQLVPLMSLDIQQSGNERLKGSNETMERLDQANDIDQPLDLTLSHLGKGENGTKSIVPACLLKDATAASSVQCQSDHKTMEDTDNHHSKLEANASSEQNGDLTQESPSVENFTTPKPVILVSDVKERNEQNISEALNDGENILSKRKCSQEDDHVNKKIKLANMYSVEKETSGDNTDKAVSHSPNVEQQENISCAGFAQTITAAVDHRSQKVGLRTEEVDAVPSLAGSHHITLSPALSNREEMMQTPHKADRTATICSAPHGQNKMAAESTSPVEDEDADDFMGFCHEDMKCGSHQDTSCRDSSVSSLRTEDLSSMSSCDNTPTKNMTVDVQVLNSNPEAVFSEDMISNSPSKNTCIEAQKLVRNQTLKTDKKTKCKNKILLRSMDPCIVTRTKKYPKGSTLSKRPRKRSIPAQTPTKCKVARQDKFTNRTQRGRPVCQRAAKKWVSYQNNQSTKSTTPKLCRRQLKFVGLARKTPLCTGKSSKITMPLKKARSNEGKMKQSCSVTHEGLAEQPRKRGRRPKHQVNGTQVGEQVNSGQSIIKHASAVSKSTNEVSQTYNIPKLRSRNVCKTGQDKKPADRDTPSNKEKEKQHGVNSDDTENHVATTISPKGRLAGEAESVIKKNDQGRYRKTDPKRTSTHPSQWNKGGRGQTKLQNKTLGASMSNFRNKTQKGRMPCQTAIKKQLSNNNNPSMKVTNPKLCKGQVKSVGPPRKVTPSKSSKTPISTKKARSNEQKIKQTRSVTQKGLDEKPRKRDRPPKHQVENVQVGEQVHSGRGNVKQTTEKNKSINEVQQAYSTPKHQSKNVCKAGHQPAKTDSLGNKAKEKCRKKSNNMVNHVTTSRGPNGDEAESAIMLKKRQLCGTVNPTVMLRRCDRGKAKSIPTNKSQNSKHKKSVQIPLGKRMNSVSSENNDATVMAFGEDSEDLSSTEEDNSDFSEGVNSRDESSRSDQGHRNDDILAPQPDLLGYSPGLGDDCAVDEFYQALDKLQRSSQLTKCVHKHQQRRDVPSNKTRVPLKKQSIKQAKSEEHRPVTPGSPEEDRHCLSSKTKPKKHRIEAPKVPGDVSSQPKARRFQKLAVCDFCGEFVAKEDMKHHLHYMHRHRCLIQGCKLFFQSKGELDSHYINQHAPELHVCVLCERYFLKRWRLDRHVTAKEHQRFERVRQMTLQMYHCPVQPPSSHDCSKQDVGDNRQVKEHSRTWGIAAILGDVQGPATDLPILKSAVASERQGPGAGEGSDPLPSSSRCDVPHPHPNRGPDVGNCLLPQTTMSTTSHLPQDRTGPYIMIESSHSHTTTADLNSSRHQELVTVQELMRMLEDVDLNPGVSVPPAANASQTHPGFTTVNTCDLDLSFWLDGWSSVTEPPTPCNDPDISDKSPLGN